MENRRQSLQMGSPGPDAGTLHHELKLEDFSRLFGTMISDIPDECCKLIARQDFRYRKLVGSEREQLFLNVLKKIDCGQFSSAGKEGKARWEKGWSENLKNFMEYGRDLSKLVPKYIRQNEPLRLDQDYIMPNDPNFELNWYEIFQQWLFTTYFKETDIVYEFGCGSGINLAKLAKLYPEKRYVGLDWAAASKEILDEMAQAYGWNIKGHLFDFFDPDESFKIEKDSIVFTLGALEQTGRDYEVFLEYLLRGTSKLCVNIEPIVE